MPQCAFARAETARRLSNNSQYGLRQGTPTTMWCSGLSVAQLGQFLMTSETRAGESDVIVHDTGLTSPAVGSMHCDVGSSGSGGEAISPETRLAQFDYTSTDATSKTSDKLDALRRRARFRAWHRGFVEADLLLGAFADAAVPDMSYDQLARFENLLAFDDARLYACLLGGPVPDGLDHITIVAIQQFHNLPCSTETE